MQEREEDVNGNKLKPSPDIVQDPLCRYRYRYVNADHRYCILVTFVIGLDGVSRSIWSKYTDNNYYEEPETNINHLCSKNSRK